MQDDNCLDCIDMNCKWMSLQDAIRHIENVLEKKKSGKCYCWITYDELNKWFCDLKSIKEPDFYRISLSCFNEEELKYKTVKHHVIVSKTEPKAKLEFDEYEGLEELDTISFWLKRPPKILGDK